jgi:glutathione synthase/RimK-type ligase-like ATP-grasp enzyme
VRDVGDGDAPVTVALVAEDRHLGNPALVEAQAAWTAQGCHIVVVVPDAAELYDVPVSKPPWSVVVSRGRHLAGLGLLAAASALGVPAVNDPKAIELVRNKIGMQAVLAHHDIPLPRTWFAGDPAVFGQLPRDRFPMVVKPYDGDGARGLALLTEPSDVALLPPITGRRSLYLAQEYLHTDGFDLKLYGIGSKVWAVRKPSPVSFPGPGPAEFTPGGDSELVEIDRQLADIALTCGRACQLELWGVDVAITPDGPVVIEVNDFPTYTSVPGAGTAIAEHVLTLVEMHAVAQVAGREHYRSIVRRPQ